MAKGDNKEGVRRALHLMKFMLEHQGQRGYKEQGGVSDAEIFAEVYPELKDMVNKGEREMSSLKKQFQRDRDLIESLFLDDNYKGNAERDRYFVSTRKNGCTYWKYVGTWTFFDISENVRVLLIGLELAQKFLYGKDQRAGNELSERIKAILPQNVHEDVETLIAGMEFEKSVLGLAEDSSEPASNEKCDIYLDLLLNAIHAEGKERYLWVEYGSPYHGSETFLFLPKQVHFTDHDWYCIGIRLNLSGREKFDFNDYQKRDDLAKVCKIRLSRILRLLPATAQPGVSLPDAADEYASAKDFPLNKVMDYVQKGNYYFPLSAVYKDEFGTTAKVHLKFTGSAVDSVKRIKLMYGHEEKTPLPDSQKTLPNGKEIAQKNLDYTAEVSLLKNGTLNPDLDRNNNLKMAIFKMTDSVTVLGPRSLQEDAIRIAQNFIDRTRAAMSAPASQPPTPTKSK